MLTANDFKYLYRNYYRILQAKLIFLIFKMAAYQGKLCIFVKNKNCKGCRVLLSIITIKEMEKWDIIVKSFKEYDVYHLSGYVKKFHIHGDGDPLLFYYEESGLRAINVVMKRQITQNSNLNFKLTNGSYFDLATPYGYGGFLIEGAAREEHLQRMNEEYSAYCKSNGIICEFVRFHPVIKNSALVEGLYNVSTLGKTITLTLDSKEQIRSNFSKEKRAQVRKARKSGVKVLCGHDEELYKEFIPMYNATMDKNKAEEYYYFENDFYNCILKDLRKNTLIFYAEYQGKKIAMDLILFANKQIHGHLSAFDRKYRHLSPTALLIYETACWGCDNGYKTLHLGGGLGCNEDNLYQFKRAFNKHSDTTFEIGRKIFDKVKYEELVKMWTSGRQTEEVPTFFPQYRAV